MNKITFYGTIEEDEEVSNDTFIDALKMCDTFDNVIQDGAKLDEWCEEKNIEPIELEDIIIDLINTSEFLDSDYVDYYSEDGYREVSGTFSFNLEDIIEAYKNKDLHYEM